MSKPPILLLDVSGMAYRAMYSIGHLDFDGVATGVVYGIFRSLLDLQELHATARVAWCFDGGNAKRTEVDASYKGNRREMTEEESEAHAAVWEQLDALRTDYLPAMGYRNVFRRKGYEADDVIASVCQDLPHGDSAVVVSADNDLWQLLSPGRVTVWTGKRSITAESFGREWGIGPSRWADVKALAGCPGDNVIGIRGVGEKTAAKFLSGRLKESTKAWQAIVKCNGAWRENLKLVRLPFPGVGSFDLVEDDVTRENWDAVVGRLGMMGLNGRHGRLR